MNEEEKKDNVLKVSVPIFNNKELKELDYKIDNYLNDIVSEINKTVSKDRDIIILKKVIEKQQKELEKKDKIIDLMAEDIEDETTMENYCNREDCYADEYIDGHCQKCLNCIIKYFTKKADEING